MKKSIVLLLLLLACVCLLAQRPHQVVVEVVASDGSVPTGSGDEIVTFTGDLYRNSSTIGIQVTQANANCFYYQDGSHGVVWVEVNDCTSSWAFGDELVIKVTCNGEKGQARVTIGSFGDNKDEVPSAQGGIHLVTYDEQAVTNNTLKNFPLDDDNDCDITPTGDGTIGVGVPDIQFTSLPGGSRAIVKCFSVEEVSGSVTSIDVEFEWTDGDPLGSSNRVLLVSPDNINWIYSTNSVSGVSGLSWADKGVYFTTTKFSHFAIGDGTTIPAVTIPNAPSGGTATANGSYVTISCRAVAVPGATYQAYYSTDFSTWTAIAATYGGGTISQTLTPNIAGTVVYYGLKAYNDNTTYQSGIGSTIYTYQKNTFQTNSGNMTNLIPIPFDGFNNNFDDARLLGITLGSNCNCIAKWDAATQRYSYCTQYAGAWRGNFDLEPDGVYFVNLTGAVADKTYNGILNKSDFDLKTGVNLIYVSALKSISDASDLMADIGAHCTKVQQWDTTNQEWSTYTGTTNDFSLSKLNPVFVYVDADVTYKK
ncbi:MAG: hypothetical protein K9M99_11625 [Candidatus Cloacimonetes bacterium]|nr:hypothetical protein [Candidatus Cloacimonadota bacterium]